MYILKRALRLSQIHKARDFLGADYSLVALGAAIAP